MSRRGSHALCAWVLGAHKSHIYSKYHVADCGGRFYFCDCGEEYALKAKLIAALGSGLSFRSLSYRVSRMRKGRDYLMTTRGPYR